MRADDSTQAEVSALVRETYGRLSTPGSNPAELFTHPDITVAGSGQGELMPGPEVVGGASAAIASWGFTWTADEITVWSEGDVAWAQVLGTVHTIRDGVEDDVPYWTTGVFARGTGGAWQWRYWGGAEPQEDPRV